jgi:hypothetical protein
VGSQAEAGNPDPAGARHAQAPTHPLTPEEFCAYAAAIDIVLTNLAEAEQTADLLLEAESGKPPTTEAEQLYTMARLCRNFVDKHTPALKTADWKGEASFLRTFKKLYDTWTTYHGVLGYRKVANWDEGPTPGRVLADLEVPRRNFITALEAYRVELGTVEGFLPTAGLSAQS